VVLWRVRYKLSLRDLPEMFLERGLVFTHEAVREWEAQFAPLLSEALRKHRLHSDQVPKPAKQKQSAARRKTGAQGKSAATHKALSRAGRRVQQVA